LEAAGFRRPFAVRKPTYFILLHCKKQNAAMQTNALSLASGIPRLCSSQRGDPPPSRQSIKMSKTASLHLAPSATFFGRFMATIDRFLMAHARITTRNGDLPYFGL
jgi:hypothetical protein